MPVIETKGALSSQGFGEFTKVGGPPVYIEDVFQTFLYVGNGATQTITNGLPLGTTASLVGKTITNLGGNFDGSYPLSNLNDGIAEIANAANIAYVPTANGYFDVYVDMGASTVVTEYLIAPQGNRGDNPFNTPTAFTVKASNDASTWTTITSFTSISTTYPDWNPGSFRSFSFTNTTGYRYWRLENTTKGSSAAGVAISEWRLVITTTPKGGLVWLKRRDNTGNHFFYDTARNGNNYLNSNTVDPQTDGSSSNTIVSFNTNGFGVGSGSSISTSAAAYTSWAFCEQPKFFDVVTYTGNGANRTISHNLGSVPGCIIIKRTDASVAWAVYHRSLANTEYMVLNTTAIKATGATYWNSTTPTATEFSLGTSTDVNADTGTYVAYLFAHDAGGFGLAGTDNVVTCGSYTGNGSATGPTVTLGYEPQWLMIKRATGSADSWYMFDNIRGLYVSSDDFDINDAYLVANTNATEVSNSGTLVNPTATGFQLTTTNAGFNANGSTYIYIAIRRGPMKVPTDATKIFYPQAVAQAATVDSTNVPFPPDLVNTFSRDGTQRTASYNQFLFLDRLRGIGIPNNTYSANGTRLISSDTAAENATAGSSYVQLKANGQDITRGGGWGSASYGNWIYYFMRRAPSFFDVVCYAGTGSNTTQTHNLGAVPELMIVKRRNATSDWQVYSASLSNTEYLVLNSTAAKATNTTYWNSTTPTSSVFSLGTDLSVNAFGSTYVAYLFTTCAGVSKVGTYTGTGNTLQIDCGFTGGARYVLIKRTNSTGDWYVWDSARGIVAGDDPYLLLNSTAAEVTNTDWVDTHNPGFELSNAAGNNVNINTATYIFLAIA